VWRFFRLLAHAGANKNSWRKFLLCAYGGIYSVVLILRPQSAIQRRMFRTHTMAVYVHALLLFFVVKNSGLHAQLLSHSMLHHIDRATLARFNLTHPDDILLRRVNRPSAQTPPPNLLQR